MLRRGAAAAADDIDQTRVGELAKQLGHEFRAFVVIAEFVRQSGVRIGADEGIGEPADLRDMRAHFACAPSAQLSPMVTGLACRTEFQNAAGVWPDSRRPERSVMVPEIITGTSSAALVADFGNGVDRRLGVERVEDGLDQQQVGAAIEQPADLFAIGRAQLIEGDGAEAGIGNVRGDRRGAVGRAERAGDKAAAAVFFRVPVPPRRAPASRRQH